MPEHDREDELAELVDQPASISAGTSSRLPVTTMSRPSACLSARTSSSPASTVVGSHCGSANVLDTTYRAPRLR